MSPLPRVGYLRVRSLDEVLGALERPGARIYAGGTDLLVALKEGHPGVADVRVLIDAKSVEEARGIDEDAGTLRIGALTTAHEMATHPLVAQHAPALREAAACTASPALRRRATVGGNLTTRHRAGDVATALLALDAAVVIAGPGGTRTLVPVDRVFDRPDARARSEFIVAVLVPTGGESGYEKMGLRRGFSRARTAVAVCTRGGALRVALAGRGDRPRIVAGPGADDAPIDEVAAALMARVQRRMGAAT